MHQRKPTKTKENNKDEDVIDVARIKQLQALAAAAQPQYGVKEVTEEAWLLTKLAFLLLRFLMGSYKWIVRVARLSAFVLLLCPALLLMAYRYFKSSNIIRDVRYGPYARNFLDIYIPPNRAGRKKGTGYPVAIFFTGGAWTIGYKLWSSLFSDVFMEEGVLYVTPDYRNFPQGYGNDMAEDVERAISWVLQNIALYGGDPENVTVVGQSAGAHLSSFVLVRKAAEELEAKLRGESEAQRRKAEAASRGDDETTDNRNGDDENGGGKPTFVQPMREAREAHARDELEAGTGEAKWSVAQIRKYIGVAGPYDLAGYVGYLHSRGLPSYMLYSIFQGELSRYSPTRIAQDLLRKYRLVDAAAAGGRRITLPFPPTVLVHGTADVTMPAKASEEFGKALQDLGVQVEVKLHRDKTHTDCIMEDIFLGDNVMLNDIVKAVTTVEQVLRRQEQEQEQEVGDDEKSSAQAGDLVDNKEQEEKEEERAGQGRSEIGEVAAKAVAAVEQKWRRLAPSYYPAFLVRTAQRVNPF